jgi:hypothetical protein
MGGRAGFVRSSWLRACRRGLGARGSYDLGSSHGHQDHQEAAGIVFEDTASALSGMEGLRVTDVQAGPGGVLEVWAVTDYPAAAACPECGTVTGRVHETVLARPRDVRRAGDVADLRWVKVRRKCGNGECPRKTFTERVPQLPPRCRPARRQGHRRRAAAGRPCPVRAPRPGRRPRVRHQRPAGTEPGAPIARSVRQDQQRPAAPAMTRGGRCSVRPGRGPRWSPCRGGLASCRPTGAPRRRWRPMTSCCLSRPPATEVRDEPGRHPR